jgi:hypothetical protein
MWKAREIACFKYEIILNQIVPPFWLVYVHTAQIPAFACEERNNIQFTQWILPNEAMPYVGFSDYGSSFCASMQTRLKELPPL